jgi:hypothetical protein
MFDPTTLPETLNQENAQIENATPQDRPNAPRQAAESFSAFEKLACQSALFQFE